MFSFFGLSTFVVVFQNCVVLSWAKQVGFNTPGVELQNGVFFHFGLAKWGFTIPGTEWGCKKSLVVPSWVQRFEVPAFRDVLFFHLGVADLEFKFPWAALYYYTKKPGHVGLDYIQFFCSNFVFPSTSCVFKCNLGIHLGPTTSGFGIVWDAGSFPLVSQVSFTICFWVAKVGLQ